jgi:MATE family multidrug resistance protein
VIYAVLLWGLGLFGGYELAYEGFAGLAPMASPVAFWIAASVALALAGTIFWAMIAVLMKERLNLKA